MLKVFRVLRLPCSLLWLLSLLSLLTAHCSLLVALFTTALLRPTLTFLCYIHTTCLTCSTYIPPHLPCSSPALLLGSPDLPFKPNSALSAGNAAGIPRTIPRRSLRNPLDQNQALPLDSSIYSLPYLSCHPAIQPSITDLRQSGRELERKVVERDEI